MLRLAIETVCELRHVTSKSRGWGEGGQTVAMSVGVEVGGWQWKFDAAAIDHPRGLEEPPQLHATCPFSASPSPTLLSPLVKSLNTVAVNCPKGPEQPQDPSLSPLPSPSSPPRTLTFRRHHASAVNCPKGARPCTTTRMLSLLNPPPSLPATLISPLMVIFNTAVNSTPRAPSPAPHKTPPSPPSLPSPHAGLTLDREI